MDWIAFIAAAGFFGLIGVVTGLLAARKGYKFLPWFFAAGPLGQTVLAFLPFANDTNVSELERGVRAERGNHIGKILAFFALAVTLIRTLAFVK